MGVLVVGVPPGGRVDAGCIPDWIQPLHELPFFPSRSSYTHESEAMRHLQDAGIYLAGDFLQFTLAELVSVPSLGALTIAEIIVWLGVRGESLLDFGDPLVDKKEAWFLARRTVQCLVKAKKRNATFLDLCERARVRKPFCYSVENYPG
jgi:hypothetical protein